MKACNPSIGFSQVSPCPTFLCLAALLLRPIPPGPLRQSQATIVCSRSRVIRPANRLLTLDRRWPWKLQGLGFVGVHAVRHHFRGSMGHLQVVIWLAGGGTAHLPTAVYIPAFACAFGSSSLGGCCHPSGWGIGSTSQTVDDGQTQCCSRETVDLLNRLSA
ncbi:hypothetical protein V8C44DRAFT_329889 [Trichoderma aethiopicum]